ncbi:response regulator transcription factor [Flavobacterium paronense]|uniref:Response regulator n=1 Tax=Flavobacterium paronense TaxID=1392775 RepID=A0ABV5GF97_9FLAO|nr:response regulator transcription factor [Flavobacterium paronense]MDN3678584.1 response regulator transcription factor [Flavobacterium paronense]
MEIQVLMVDDHPPIIEGYRSILAYNSFGYILNTTAAHSCEAAYNEIFQANHPFDIVFLDLTLPPYFEKNINTGDDLIPVVRKQHPNAKIIILTSHSESIVLFKIINEYKLEGVLVKSDFQAQQLIDAFDTVIKGGTYFSETVMNHQKSWGEKNKVMDSYNRQILSLLSQGVKTKSIPNLLHLSKSAIDKRKSLIKQLLGIDKGNDEDILKEARKQGLI